MTAWPQTTCGCVNSTRLMLRDIKAVIQPITSSSRRRFPNNLVNVTYFSNLLYSPVKMGPHLLSPDGNPPSYPHRWAWQTRMTTISNWFSLRTSPPPEGFHVSQLLPDCQCTLALLYPYSLLWPQPNRHSLLLLLYYYYWLLYCCLLCSLYCPGGFPHVPTIITELPVYTGSISLQQVVVSTSQHPS